MRTRSRAELVARLERMTAKFWASPKTVNGGDCWLWAVKAAKILPGVAVYRVELPDESWHAFVCWRGRWHDSESPNGVRNWR